ncbi:MAG: SGNH/GDSL hydrolase family protein [Thermomicrobiales bacterium]
MTDLPSIDWHDLGEPQGKGWTNTVRRYDRLPERAHGLVPEIVWDLSRNSNGLFNRFRTNATTIRARWTLGLEQLAMPHMPATSVSGVDLYAEDETGHSRWVGVGQPETFPHVDVELATGLDAGERIYTIYLPLFNNLERIEIGLPSGSSFEMLPADDVKPVVYYGTSIIHGASASRSGMALPSILSRRLGRTVMNLGFSGNAKMEVELAQLIGEIDAALYVIDCLPNMDSVQIEERALPFLNALREARPTTPILLIEDRTFTNAWIMADRRDRHATSRAALTAAFDARLALGDTNLHYLEGASLLGNDDDATVDSSHPTDLGFVRMADILTPIFTKLLD